MASATIDTPGASVGSSFTVSGNAPNCSLVTVIVTTANGTTNYDAPVSDGTYSVTVTDVPAGAVEIKAYCTAAGIGTAATHTCTATDS